MRNLDNLKVHYSLLPAFQSDDPVRDAILAGVKVTGITLTLDDRIIAQYPMFITNDMHYDELKLYLEHIAGIMLPLVKEKLINNEAFEIQTLMGNTKCGGCKGCSERISPHPNLDPSGSTHPGTLLYKMKSSKNAQIHHYRISKNYQSMSKLKIQKGWIVSGLRPRNDAKSVVLRSVIASECEAIQPFKIIMDNSASREGVNEYSRNRKTSTESS